MNKILAATTKYQGNPNFTEWSGKLLDESNGQWCN